MSHWGRIGVALKAHWGRIGVALGWLWGAYQLAINTLWSGFDVASISHWGGFGPSGCQPISSFFILHSAFAPVWLCRKRLSGWGSLPPAPVSLSSFGGEGWGEEAVTPGGSCCPCLPQRLCPSPRAPLAGRGRNTRWQCQEAPGIKKEATDRSKDRAAPSRPKLPE
jgi:hypothetical protein